MTQQDQALLSMRIEDELLTARRKAYNAFGKMPNYTRALKLYEAAYNLASYNSKYEIFRERAAKILEELSP